MLPPDAAGSLATYRESARIIAAPLSAIIAVGVLVLPEVMVGIDRGIDHAKSGQPVKPQPLIDDRQRIAGRAHPGGADRMKDRGADIAGGFRQRGIVVADRRARQEFLGMIGRKRRLLHQPARGADRVGGDLAVFVGRKVVRRDRRRLIDLRGANPHRAAGGRLQIAGADRDRGKAVQRVAELVERQRLHVKLDIGTLAARIRAGENPEL